MQGSSAGSSLMAYYGSLSSKYLFVVVVIVYWELASVFPYYFSFVRNQLAASLHSFCSVTVNDYENCSTDVASAVPVIIHQPVRRI